MEILEILEIFLTKKSLIEIVIFLSKITKIFKIIYFKEFTNFLITLALAIGNFLTEFVVHRVINCLISTVS